MFVMGHKTKFKKWVVKIVMHSHIGLCGSCETKIGLSRSAGNNYGIMHSSITLG